MDEIRKTVWFREYHSLESLHVSRYGILSFRPEFSSAVKKQSKKPNQFCLLETHQGALLFQKRERRGSYLFSFRSLWSNLSVLWNGTESILVKA